MQRSKRIDVSKRTRQTLASLHGEGVRLGPMADGNYGVSLPPGEKCVPLALMFYDPGTRTFQFRKTPGISMREFVSIMRRLLPNYGK